MLPFGIGFSEIFVVFLVLIVFVGPEGIPQAVRAIAKVIRAIRSMVDEVRYSEGDEVKREILQPLEEARRFNPKRKAEEWVRREIEEPVQQLTKEQVEDFKVALESESHAEASAEHEVEQTKSETTQIESQEALTESSIDELTVSEGQTESKADGHRITSEALDDSDYDDDLDNEEPFAVTALDPLDRVW